ncbi:MAG: hypothetical protein HS111_24840 [Kofleriaceae bacterium]|nr:hypothetical protein [Kofleriaceae bacterium]MCL4225391.1 hypothetical protein [Myxococcales bacterium]
MDGVARTHRDTIAFVLAILGAATWSVFPTIALLHDRLPDRALGTDLILATALVVGAALGAASAATLWRQVALATAGVAGALTAALAVGVMGQIDRGASTAPLAALLTVLVTALAAVGGAVIGRRTRRPWPGLVAAWIVLAASGMAWAGLGLAAVRGASIGAGLITTALLVASLLGAVAAGLLDRRARPSSMAAWLLGLEVSTFAIVALNEDSSAAGVVGVFIGGLLLSLLFVGAAALGLAAVRRHQPPPTVEATVPTAEVVER